MSSATSDHVVHRALAVPEGLDGERLDAALARLFGFSRTRAVELISQGLVQLDGAPPMKSDRVSAGAWLQVELPATAPSGPAIVATPVAGMLVVHDDDDIVVVD
ncbi:MAG: S4 domain-containing protein, partial [Acidothermaceae bacterium]